MKKLFEDGVIFVVHEDFCENRIKQDTKMAYRELTYLPYRANMGVPS
jgi:hypothetical protein